MYQRRLIFDERSYLEVATRIHNGEEKPMITIVGPKNENEITASSVILTKQDLATLSLYISELLQRKEEWPQKSRE